MHKILFVCTGNTCRSSMAKGIFEAIINEKGKAADYEVDSAGIFAFENDSASIEAIEALKDYSIDISGHRAKRLTGELVKSAELILCMTLAHKQHIIKMYPSAQDKTYTLLEFAALGDDKPLKGRTDITDPIGLSLDMYKECAKDIYSALMKAYDRIEGFDKA